MTRVAVSDSDLARLDLFSRRTRYTVGSDTTGCPAWGTCRTKQSSTKE